MQLVEEICEGLTDEEATIEIEKLAREYNMQEGMPPRFVSDCFSLRRDFLLDASMKVSLPILERVYHALNEKTERQENGEQEFLDPHEHLFFIDAYDMPLFRWSQTRSTFEKWVGLSCSHIHSAHSDRPVLQISNLTVNRRQLRFSRSSYAG